MSAENVLFGHSSHAALPVCALNDPGKHAEHAPPSGPVYPVLHVHVVDVLAPRATEYELAGHPAQVPAAVAPTVNRYVPAEQSEQAAEPLTSLYLPATHPEHVPPFAPVYPTLQAHAATSELELGAFEFEGQATHVDDVLAPAIPEYVAIPQSVHETLPVLALYLPATQDEQTPPFGPVNPALQ